MYFKKTMVLTALDNSKHKAVLNIERDRDQLKGSVRLYNFAEIPSGILTLGILSQGLVFKAGLHSRGNGLFSFETAYIEGLNKFSCALVNIKDGKATPILLGSEGGHAVGNTEIRLASSISVLDEKNLTREKAEEVLDRYGIDYDDDEKEEIEKAIDAELGRKREEFKLHKKSSESSCLSSETPNEKECDNKCANCGYREAFFSEENIIQVESHKVVSEPNKELMPDKKTEMFFDEIKDQIDTLFGKYPEDSFLTEVIPNSKWCKVEYDETGEYYVVGIIYEGNDIKFLCYGVPAIYSGEPPKELGGYCQWFPIDPDKPEDFGYWLMYQDAETGESIEVSMG